MSGLALEDTVIAAGSLVSVRFTVENRGRATSAVSEVRVCLASSAQCIGEPVELTVPTLRSGERLVVAQPVSSAGASDIAPPYTLLVRVDPDRATDEANRANNDASARVRLDTALLIVDAVDLPSALTTTALQLPVQVVVRNHATAAASAPSRLQLGGNCSHGTYPWGDPATQVRIPVLAPGAAWAATVHVRHPNALWQRSYSGNAPCLLEVQTVPSGAAPPTASTPVTQRTYRFER